MASDALDDNAEYTQETSDRRTIGRLDGVAALDGTCVALVCTLRSRGGGGDRKDGEGGYDGEFGEHDALVERRSGVLESVKDLLVVERGCSTEDF